MIHFDREICRDLGIALHREWLETNGIGGFASSTIIGLNTRRYHGLLTAALNPPSERMVLLAKLEEVLVVDGRRHELSANQYPGVIHPKGQDFQQSFALDPFPVFTWLVEDLELRKSLFLIQGENGVVVQYFLRAQGGAARRDCRLEVRPLIAYRDYHQLTHENPVLNRLVTSSAGMACVLPYASLPPLYFAHDAEQIESLSRWYYDFEYERERDRGLDYREDLFNPFALTFDLRERTQANIVASLDKHAASEAGELRLAETVRRKALGNGLLAAASQFLVKRGQGDTIIAGYPWFEDWGRDTMISLPGLTLATGRPEIAKSILIEWSRFVDRGMLPNRFPDAGSKSDSPQEYNTADAALWFFEAIRAVVEQTGDYSFVSDALYGILADIVAWHQRGTRYGIHMDADGLLATGAPGVQLTWMDAKVRDWVVTPRKGKPVEIQALWYNALRIMEDFSTRRGLAGPYGEMAEAAKHAFVAQFWNESAGCLYDVIDGDGRDSAIRPNQVLALSLKYRMPYSWQAKSILKVVERELLTPFGLRTLAPGDPSYRGRYEGDTASRDGAYHQGSVWPWLIGPFIAAYLEEHQNSADAVARARSWLGPLRQFRDSTGVGQIPELFDGDAPHRPRGCTAQAWSVAEVIRASKLVD
ncbi:MAG: amylo-alpha-1,6-glucosidase [Acidobacteriota bacterium]|nr:amylo-alpha-1,6-glucosidase [Acidobacteriota bacterium]